MKIFQIFAFCFGLSVSYGLKCADISGYWRNELGSRMLLNVGDSNYVSGEFYTAVETVPGAAAIVSNITGVYSNQGDGSLLAFSVHFNHGLSMTSWVGQCAVCEGKEVLHTSYVYRKYAQNLHEKWATIIVNQNTFFRFDDEIENELVHPATKAYFPGRALSVVTNKDPGGIELSGKWKSSSNEEIEIFQTKEKVLLGKHLSTNIIGRKDGDDSFTAVTLISAGSKRIRSWTGYVYDTPPFLPKVLETSWLEHEFNPSCAAARETVRFGVQNFTRVATGNENEVKKSETFMDKIRKFFSSMF